MFSKLRIFLAKAPHAALLHTQKINPQWQVPKCMRYRRERAAVSRSTICLLGVGFSLRQVVFVRLVYFLSGLHHDFWHMFLIIFLATLRLQEQKQCFFG